LVGSPFRGLDPAQVRLAVELRQRVEERTGGGVGRQGGGHVGRQVGALRSLRFEDDRDRPADLDSAVACPRRPEREAVAVADRVDAAAQPPAIHRSADEVAGLLPPDSVGIERDRDHHVAARARGDGRREPLGGHARSS
jgi:hypothetical protein